MPILHLTDRALVRLSGTDAETLLQRLITTDLNDVAIGKAGYGALLTPQGKILFDFLVHRHADGFVFDLDGSIVEGFIKKMKLYRMRSDVGIEELSTSVGVSFEAIKDGVRDPRADTLGWRAHGDAAEWQNSEGMKRSYLQKHIEAVVPQAGLDFAYEDAFPHDINMDDLKGLDFEKGCYVGQEVVSRMEHRGSARKRLVQVRSDTALPENGTAILADGKSVGRLGAVADCIGLAIMRLDRANAAINEGINLTASNNVVSIHKPAYATFDF